MCLTSSKPFSDTRTPMLTSALCQNKHKSKTQTHLHILNLTKYSFNIHSLSSKLMQIH
ncbi:hypothetical protein N665_0295s0002 [Sinapis alba]|nr:hypothetical protein N665_0295s0002 [Sinapis alba]